MNNSYVFKFNMYFITLKSERERALNFIEKIKSQPNLQLENLECNICDPPRVFTAAATLLSHYKSHAGL